MSLQVDHLVFSEIRGPRLNVFRFVSENAQVEFECGLDTQIEYYCWPNSLFSHISELGNLYFSLLVLLDHSPGAWNVFDSVWHDISHFFEVSFRAKLLEKLTALEFDAVALISLLFLGFDPVSELRVVSSSSLHDLEVHGDALVLGGLPISQIDLSLVLENANHVTI